MPDPVVLGATRHGAGPRVVLVHGFTQSARSWGRVAAALAHDHEVVAVDLPGHGASGEVRPANLEATAALVGEAGGRAAYVGYSLGGRVCLTLALARPDLVERLVLVGATPGISDETERAARRAADEALADRLDPPRGERGLDLETFLEEWLAGPLFAHLSPEQADRPARRDNTPAGLAASLRSAGTGTQTPSHDRLGGLSMPVLLLAGAEDARFSAIAHEMAARIGASASVGIVAGAGHAVPFEAPEAFLAAVRAFLGAPPGPHQAIPTARSSEKQS